MNRRTTYAQRRAGAGIRANVAGPAARKGFSGGLSLAHAASTGSKRVSGHGRNPKKGKAIKKGLTLLGLQSIGQNK